MNYPDPTLVLRKSGPATMDLGQWGNFGIDIQNTGGTDAWNVSLRDLLPHVATGGMCNLTPQILSAQVFAADGVTPVAGKGPLNPGSDYSLNYSAAPNCQLDITMLTAAGTISPNQHLILRYRTQLDANSQNGATLTNIAGAIQWFNGASGAAGRKTYTGPLTNGTPGILDNQDAWTVTVALTAPASDPALVLRKSGPATMNLGQWGNFGVDIQNTGGSDAWNVSLRDLLPSVATGGMCTLTPQILSAQVFAADGVTPVAGKGPLSQGSDYSLNYTAAPSCQLNITMLTAAGTISPNQHLILHYQTQLDANSQNGATLTNIAGAIQWFNGASSVAGRKTYTGPLTNGTPGILDNQDAFTVTVALTAPVSDPALVMRKSGPATMSLGQWGNFGLDVQNIGQSDAWNVSLRDLLPTSATGGMCNLTPQILIIQVFAADGITPVAGRGPLNQGSDYLLNYSGAPNCQVDVTILTAAGTIGPDQHLILRYRTQLDASSQNGATLTNIAGAIQWFNSASGVAGRKTYTGPLTNGTPGILDNQDAWTVTVVTAPASDPALVLRKSGPATMNPGQWGNFGVDVQNTGGSDAWNVSLRDLLPAGATGGMCNLTPQILSAQVFAADGVTAVVGKGLLNQGTDYSLNYSGAPNCQLNITMLTAAATISPNQRLIIHYQTQLDANTQNGAALTNVAGAIQWFNGDSSVVGRTTYSGPLTNGTPGVLDNQDAFTVTALTAPGDPALVLRKSGPATMNLGQWGTFGIDVQNTGGSDAWNVSLRDLLPNGATGGMCNLAPQIVSAQVFAADGVTAVAGKGPLSQGNDYSLNYSGAPNCQVNITMMTAAATISPNQRLIIYYQTQLDANSQNGVTLTNVAGAIQWFNGDSSVAGRKTYTGPLTNGTPGILDNQDAFTVTVALTATTDPALVLRKSGPATMSLGQWGTFSIDVQNTGGSDAWNVSLRDMMPNIATGGMCTLTPQILSAQVFAADGVTTVAGKVPLNQGSDYSLSYSAAPNCQLDIVILTTAGLIGPNQRLIIYYQTQLDANSQSGATLTNVAGAIQWFNGISSFAGRKTYTGLLTNGTPGILDNQDAFTVTVAATATDPTLVLRKSGPATMNLGQWGNFGVDIQNTGGSDAWNVSLRDLLPSVATGGMCTLTPQILSAQVFAADGVTAVAGKGPLNQGSDYSFSYSGAPNCQLNITMLTAVGTISPNQHLIIQYQTQLDANSQNGATLTNIAGAIQWFNGDSSVASRKTYTGPLTNGTPGILDNQDAWTVTVVVAAPGSDPALVLRKSGPATMNLGQWGNFGVDIQNTGGSDAWNVSLRDLLPSVATGGMCTLTPQILSAQVFAADGVTPVAGKGPLNQGSDYSFSYSAAPNCVLNITMLTAIGTISPNQHLILHYQTQLDANSQTGATLTNIAGAIQWFNGDSSVASRKTYTGPLTNGTPGILDNQDAWTVTVVTAPGSDPAMVLRKSGPATMNLGQWGNFGIDVQNTGGSDAWNVSLRDLLPNGATGGMCNLTPQMLSAQVFAADGVTAVAGKGPLNQGSDYSLSYSAAPNCQLNITMLTAAATISPNQRLIIHYQTQLDANSQSGATLTNIAGAIQWFNGDSSVAGRKTYIGPLTNGTPGILDNQDAWTVTVVLTGYEFDKTVADLTSGANPATTAAPGDKLRYTLRFRTTTQALSNFSIVDDMDALNAQADFAAGTLTLVTTPAGADISNTSSTGGTKSTGVIDIRNLSLPANSVALIQFDITLQTPIANGTVVTNQATLRLANGTTFAWSDDPNVNGIAADPTVPNGEDPTRVTIASAPAFREQKISTYLRDPNVLLVGDTLRYTITVKNISNANALSVALRDAVPANTTYVAGSTTLNGAAVADVAGMSPLVNGTLINSPADPTPGSMPADPSSSQANVATITFNVVVSPNTPNGTVICNQSFVSVPGSGIVDQPSDDPRTPAPNDRTCDTVGVAGAGQQLSITNQVSVVGGGAAVPGAQLDYVVSVTNIAAVPASNVVITDDLNGSQPGQLAYVNASAAMNNLVAGVSFAGSTITANYAAVNGTLAPGGVVVLKFRATLNSGLALGTVVTNTAVATWNNPTQTTSASVSITIGSTPGNPRVPVSAVLNGSAWYDANFDNVQDPSERALSGWAVELYLNNQLSQSVQTDANGVYRIVGVAPNDTTGVRYELRLHAPGAGPNTAMLGLAASPFTNGLQRISDIILTSGANLEGLNLPIHPNGVTYDSVARTPIAGATLSLLDGRSSPLPAGCFDDAAQQGQITLADGYYRFDINFSDPACPSGGDYLIAVTAPLGTNYVSGNSQIIPPTSSASTAAFSVPACPGSAADAIASTQFCEAQPSAFAPAASVPPRSAGTTYYIHLRLDGSQIPGSSQIFDNHIPLDPQVAGTLTITKTTPLLNVSRGQLIPYTITANNHSSQMLTGVSIVDSFPAGFSYVQGSGLIDGVPTEPSVAGLTLTWNGLTIAGTQTRTVKLLLTVGAGVTGGDFVNRAQAFLAPGAGVTAQAFLAPGAGALRAKLVNRAQAPNVLPRIAMSGEATATVRLMPDITFDCTDVTGKVFNDANRNGWQDDGEEGLPGVRVVTPTGLQATTDKYGRYHITCVIVPNGSRGSNFVLKLDDRTLPSGYRMTTDQVQIQRATNGKTLQVNFGASIHRVVSLDLLDAAFEPGTSEIRAQWRPRVNLLLEELRKAPAVLRLSYVADTEDAALVKRRVEAVKRQLNEAWGTANDSYMLTIEPEVFWRRGGPPKQSEVRVPESR